MTEPAFEQTITAGVAHLRLCRPLTLNALTFAGIEAFGAAVRALGADPTVRCLVISSTGRHFSAGMQLEEFLAGGADLAVDTPRQRLRLRASLERLMRDFDALDAAPFPVIAAIQGGCIGGGVDLVAAADIRYGAADAFFSIQEINVGLIADLGTLQRLPKLIPAGIVREYAYTGRRMPAARALELGLLNAIHPTAEATLAAALELAAEIAAKSPLAIAGTKHALNYARDHATDEALEHMAVLQSALLAPEDIRAAVAALKSRGTAVYADR
jgi:enoyl-CoA hydratase